LPRGLTISNNNNSPARAVGIGNDSPSHQLDVTGTFRATGATTLGSTLAVTGALTLSTTTATPTSLLGKDGSNVVGTVTTVAQTGLMTRGETTETTGSPSAIFTVTHGLGSTPTSVLVTSAGIGGGDKIIFEVYTKNSTTFSVQAWNYDGTEASGKQVKIYWLALK
jgi:fibronectin-binding autotransporter adhesin